MTASEWKLQRKETGSWLSADEEEYVRWAIRDYAGSVLQRLVSQRALEGAEGHCLTKLFILYSLLIQLAQPIIHTVQCFRAFLWVFDIL